MAKINFKKKIHTHTHKYIHRVVTGIYTYIYLSVYYVPDPVLGVHRKEGRKKKGLSILTADPILKEDIENTSISLKQKRNSNCHLALVVPFYFTYRN